MPSGSVDAVAANVKADACNWVGRLIDRLVPIYYISKGDFCHYTAGRAPNT